MCTTVYRLEPPYWKWAWIVHLSVCTSVHPKHFPYLLDEPYARDLQAQGACALQFLMICLFLKLKIGYIPICNFYRFIQQSCVVWTSKISWDTMYRLVSCDEKQTYISIYLDSRNHLLWLTRSEVLSFCNGYELRQFST